MNFHLPPAQAVIVVTHWFSQWNEWEREVFVDTLSALEQTNCYLAIEPPPMSSSECLFPGDAVTDAYLAGLLDSSLHLISTPGSSSVFECQLRLFRKWYPEWPLAERTQLAEFLKESQLRALHDSSFFPTPISSDY
ncbi:unnamed protein product [Calicophoron daubneyi]|uniref:Uncharacterized protein n=1 Tax=Calicophoron daubneyi TaxID=300641 RepID=A0AAV2TVZ9_CALDB